jgi:hypothetical protein
MKNIAGFIAVAAFIFFMIPLIYLLITGPISFVVCAGYSSMFSPGNADELIDKCLGADEP